MAGIYLHIPFCKQACHYCDFHFSTNLKKKQDLLTAMEQEIAMRRDELDQAAVETVYFGGGTPSILSTEEIERLLAKVNEYHPLAPGAEITLEANPDDLDLGKIEQLADSPINRLSIGIQSFFDTDLKLMHRAHNANEAKTCLEQVSRFFENNSIDLIYGIPGADDAQWLDNIEMALAFGMPHISSYALTVEPKTALKTFIDKGVVPDVDDEQAHRQFHLMVDRLEKEGYVHYELSNFGKPGFFSKNNSAYWQGKPYLGIGPSAHSFDGQRRAWNLRNNPTYVKKIQAGELPLTYETLSTADRYNEYVMTGLRTIWGVSSDMVISRFGQSYAQHLEVTAKRHIAEGLLFWDGDVLHVTKKGKFLADGLASDLFKLN
ncbi:radical SAM family heme chaperone HemW [Flagellimonas sp. DF-77]|uniref:radical SAM family heme chaperone HemW n=1 Tax=Flagellimonas algarum TaxID=3230298 RepID=UPI003391786D